MILLLRNIFNQEAWVIGNIVLIVLCFLVQLLYYAFINRKSIYICNANNTNVSEPVSVIIAAKNEAENLRKFLPKILEQNYPNFEVVVINDYSSDNTLDTLYEIAAKYPKLRILNNKQGAGKKQALTYAINESKFEYLVFIDADCYTLSKNWLIEMASGFNEKKHLVLGYGAYEKKAGFANAFIRYDTQLIAKQYFAASSIGKSYMGVGRNMAYKKELWEAVNGYQSHKDLLSGDDDLFIAEVATSENVSVIISDDSITYSIPEKTLSGYARQKTRHISTSKKYSTFAKIFSGIEIASRSMFYALFVILMFSDLMYFAVSLLILRLIFVRIIGVNANLLFNNASIFYYFVIFDIFAPVFYLFVMIKRVFIRNDKKW